MVDPSRGPWGNGDSLAGGTLSRRLAAGRPSAGLGINLADGGGLKISIPGCLGVAVPWGVVYTAESVTL